MLQSALSPVYCPQYTDISAGISGAVHREIWLILQVLPSVVPDNASHCLGKMVRIKLPCSAIGHGSPLEFLNFDIIDVMNMPMFKDGLPAGRDNIYNNTLIDS